MCNGANHTSGCECGFGPPYPGTISQVSSVDWTESAAHSREAFKKTLEELNLDADVIRKFNREYGAVQASAESSKIGKLKQLFGGLRLKDEETKIVSINVPLFRLHSPSVKGAKVIYREIGQTTKRERGWLVTVFGQGTGPTNTYKVIYDPPFESVDGECRQVYVPLQLEVTSIAAYESGRLAGRGIRLGVKGLEDEMVLRKRGCELLDAVHCRNHLAGPVSTLNYNRKKESKPHTEPFTQLWGTHVRDSIELETIKVFNTTITPVAELEHLHQLDLEFKLPGKRNYVLRYNNSGLQWTVS